MSTWTCLELEIDTDYGANPNGLLAAWDDTGSTADSPLGGTAELQPLASRTRTSLATSERPEPRGSKS